ncbi:thiol:disulfide interchange protein DsbA/DsbL [Solimonas marina]|uniref:Thiol:disulfide interchange protein DsbA/DsbL n=1 Tax=Solimonas marina TaxID=2714601 RepID=A0A969W542_9GAMM|nr:thiol:disulfide interchange protein DsbA/DsbL [Solimonas marina]NKF20747.1 thiol:disulfide interchange protein DsbA/DsbL [Solimonas marina]
MKLRYLLAVGLLATVAACSKSQDSSAPAAPAATESAAPAAPADTSADTAADSGAAADAPAPASETADAAASEAPAPTPPPAPAAKATATAATSDNLQEGVDYIRIPNGSPFQPENGKVEVAEVFNYVCPACNAFNPTFEKWKATLPSDVNVVYVPADFRQDFKAYAKAYYAADALGLVAKTHDAVYAAIHEQHTLPGEGMVIDPAKVAAFYAKYGADPKQFEDLMSSFSVNAKVLKAHQFMMQSQVRSTPSLVIDGKYLVKGKSWDDIVKNAAALVARERAS